MVSVWSLKRGMRWCLSGFARLTNHKMALLILAVMTVPSFSRDQWTLKNKLFQHTALIQAL